jgi:hypothetical protein
MLLVSALFVSVWLLYKVDNAYKARKRRSAEEVTVVSKIKLYSKLDALEDHLKASLVPHLQVAAKGGNDLVFCVTVFNSVRELKNSTDTLTEELIEVGAQVLSLRTKLGEPSDGTIAERLCWYCRQWSGLDNGDKISSQVLAKKFLLEIENSLLA